jgi:hypothetical protein
MSGSIKFFGHLHDYQVLKKDAVASVRSSWLIGVEKLIAIQVVFTFLVLLQLMQCLKSVWP